MQSVKDITWPSWVPQQRAVLLFVVRDNQVLLIHKKRGLGKGKINAPGGRIEPGETPRAAATRETVEEVGVTPLRLALSGELHFQFLDGLSLHCTVFRADDCIGTAIETDEARPLWVSCQAIPYDRMWQDDTYWLPHMLARKTFRGYFLFKDDHMLDMHMDDGPLGPLTHTPLTCHFRSDSVQ